MEKNIINFLRENKIKITPQRRLILELVLKDRTHPCAEEVYLKVREKMPDISIATVYQTLELLEKKGILLKIDFPDGKSHYDPYTIPHLHFYCTNCKNIIDFEFEDREIFEKFINKIDRDFEIKNYAIILYGICKNCKKNF
jgi:Fur family peroxide stress response transcriptional regulator